MIKENKKNKIITFLCACLMVCASALGLVSAVGTTLASSPTQPTITADYFNYNSSNFLNLFDGVFEGITPYTFGTYVPEEHFFPSPADCRFRILSGEHTFDYYSSNHFVYYFNNNTIYSSSPYYTSDNGNYYTFLLSPPFDNSEFVNNSQLLDIKQDLFVIVIYGDDGIYRTYCSKTAYDYNQVYLNGQNNVVNNPGAFGLYTQAQYQQNYVNGQNSVINNPSAFGLYTQAQYEQNYTDGYYAGIIQGQNNVIDNPNNFGLNTNQQLEDSYNQGFADGEQSLDAYQNGYDTGYTDGSNEVLNNPNNYNLYTQAQYEQNYQDGFNQGLETARYGSFGSYDGYLNIRSHTAIDGVPTYQQTYNKEQSFEYKGSTVIIKPTLLTTLSERSEDYFIYIGISFNNPFTYSDKTAFNFANNYLLSRYLTIDYTLSDINNNAYVCSYVVTPIYDSENNLVDYNVVNNVPIDVYGKVINGLLISTTNNVEQLSKIALSQNSIDYENGYNVGYETGYNNGTNSDVVHNAYSEGYTRGKNVGYQDGLSNGLAHSNDYTFFGLIGAVIDAPIQYLSSLFNFNLLGFNLFAFITSLFTVCVIIWIVKMLLGGK